MKCRLAAGVLLGLLLILLALIPVRASVSAAQSDPAAEILRVVNEYRASLGLPPFQYNGALASAAQGHANWMAANVIFSHTGEGGSTPYSRATAAGYSGRVVENIVGGMSMSPRQGLIWWQNSPIHHNTLVSTRYVEAGTGFATNGTQNMYVLVVGIQSEGGLAPPYGDSNDSTEPLIVTPIKLAEPREDGSIVHLIAQGQAMWTIAAYYDVDLNHLFLINALTVDDVLHPGDEVTVRLADGVSPPPTPTPPLTHIVRDGDSAWSIAGRYRISVDDFFWYNSLDRDTTLQPGDKVTIRLAEGQAPPPTPTPKTSHIVQGGESAWTIAAFYDLTVDQLLALNDLATDAVLRPGDALTIRQPTATPMPSATPTTPPDADTPTPISLVENLLSSDLSPTLIPAGDDLSVSESSVVDQPTPFASSDEGIEAGGGLDLLAVVAAGLAVAGAVVLINARRQRR